MQAFTYFRSGSGSIWAGLLGIAALAGTVGCDSKITRPVEAKVLAFEGSSLADGGAAGASRSVTKETRLGKGATLSTGNDAGVSLMLLPGALLEVGANSEFTVEELKISKKGDTTDEAMERVIRGRFVEGTLFATVQFESEPGDWMVETPHGTLSTLSGGSCRLEVRKEGTRLTCLRGAFTFNPRGGSETAQIEAGFVQGWPSAGAGPFLAETDARGQDEIMAALEVERNLLSMQSRERLSPYPWKNLEP